MTVRPPRPSVLALAACLTLFGLLVSAPPVPGARADDAEADTASAEPPSKQELKYRAEFEKKRRKALIGAGHRHLELGVWCRKQGLVAQASSELVRAVEVSDNRHPGANKVLSMMRSMGEGFWSKRRRKTHVKLLERYEKRAASAEEKGQKDRFALAEWAWDRELSEGKEEFLALLEETDAPLDVDDKGHIVVPVGKLPAELSKEILDEAVSINGRLYVRDRFLALIPDVAELHEVQTERVRVRSQSDLEEAQEVLAACEALLPFLTEDTGGRPKRLMTVFLFKDRKTYEAYLDAADMPGHKKAAGLALSRHDVALVNGDGAGMERVLETALHELSHLFMFGVTRSAMPSWYAEGFAETYGGGGVFKWKDGKLTTRGVLAKRELDSIRGDGFIPLATFFQSNALTLIQSDKSKARGFYAQSWAFVRYMRTAAGDDLQERFLLWEDQCRGSALGAEFGKPDGGNAKPSQQLFEQKFDGELEAIESGFKEWLQTL